jgi:hypothetical protein
MTVTDHMAARDSFPIIGTPISFYFDKPPPQNTFTTQHGPRKPQASFNTYRHSIKIEKCCSPSMSGVLTDFFTGSLRPIPPKPVFGYDGSHSVNTHIRTIRWVLADDSGIYWNLIIPASLYNPTNKTRLLSPQHFARQPNGQWTAPSATPLPPKLSSR